MQIGLIGGTGPAGRALAARLASVGHDVLVGSRSALRAAELVDELGDRYPDRELGISGVSNGEAAFADVVVVATPWDAAAPTAAEYASQLRGKLVICMANALARVGSEFHALYPPRGSIAADVQAAVPDARVAAAFQHLPAYDLGDLTRDLEGDVLVCADRQDAIDDAIELVGTMTSLRGLDCGRLSSAAPVEAFTAVLMQLNRRYKTRTAVRITGI